MRSPTSEVRQAFTAEFEPPLSDAAYYAVPQTDGGILVAGRSWTAVGQEFTGIGRLHHDGTLDTSFSPVRRILPSPLAVQADGKTLLSGLFELSIGGSDFGRINTDGTLDAGFNPSADGYGNPAVVQPDGKILVGGEFATMGGQACTNSKGPSSGLSLRHAPMTRAAESSPRRIRT